MHRYRSYSFLLWSCRQKPDRSQDCYRSTNHWNHIHSSHNWNQNHSFDWNYHMHWNQTHNRCPWQSLKRQRRNQARGQINETRRRKEMVTGQTSCQRTDNDWAWNHWKCLSYNFPRLAGGQRCRPELLWSSHTKITRNDCTWDGTESQISQRRY